MIKINRATAAKIVDYNFDYLRTLEESGLITPNKKNYTYNQLILTRIFLLIKDAIPTKHFVPFLTKFGSTIQHEVIFTEVELMIVINEGFFCIPNLEEKVRPLADTYFKPLNQESFICENLDTQGIEALKAMAKMFYYNISNPDSLIIIPVNRVRTFIDKRAIDLGLNIHIDKAKELEKFDKEGILLIG